MKVFFTAVLILFVFVGISCLPSFGQPVEKATFLVLKNAMVIDGVSSVPQLRTILIEGAKITKIVDSTKEKPVFPEGAFIMNLEGHYIIPGLIDGHVHISHDSRQEIEMILKEALLGGITAVRDMGGDSRVLASLRRDALINNIDAPNIYYSSLMAGPTFFTDPRVISGTRGRTPGQTPWALEITATTDIRQAIAETKGSGATGIKIYADLPPKEIDRLTAECRKQGVRSWSHGTIHPAGPMDAVMAGVETLSHAPLLAWHNKAIIPPSYTKRYDLPHKADELKSPAFTKLFQEMKKRGTILDATVYIFQLGVIKNSSGKADKNAQEAIARYAKEATRIAHQQGVKIAAGTDFLLDPKNSLPNLHDELEILVSGCGLTPMEAILAATRNNAEVIGIQDKAGTIEVGKQADLVVLAADPTKDIKNTRKIRYVLKSGRVFIRQ
jgi:imidazolonepropionase-like amidohydrolase